ncbi:LOG family protein [Streptomyces aureocirculatus]|uniref:LOG family protein n=1 Tax=Streptomyces aureocirculatus TaxID=67275 RepID=UPI0004C89ABC|nr:TIGR00730 family Rossman fold protein [Streptomyces aureocirculatus]
MTVFCGAGPAVPVYMRAAAATGRLLAEHNIHVVYGGARLGLMGALADAALAAGGEVTGVIPHALHTADITHPGLSHLHVVQDTATRKKRLTDLTDGILALPGGLGTLDELACVWAAAVHGTHTGPVGLLNTCGYYNPLLEFLRTANAAGFLAHHPGLRLENLVLADDDPVRLLHSIAPHTALLTLANVKEAT